MAVTLHEAIEKFSGLSILCVGDLALDKYLEGRVQRLSPEAPCPVILNATESTRPGCIGNVACNVKALGANVTVIGTIGDDSNGQRLRSLLALAGVDMEYLVTDKDKPTTCKTRVMSGSHHFVRLDNEIESDSSEDVQADLISAVRACLISNDNISAIILSDYDKGVLTEKVIQTTIAEARDRGIPVIADPKQRHFWDFAGVTIFKPNISCLASALGSEGDVEDMAKVIRRDLLCDALVVTQGASGMRVCSGAGSVHIPARLVSVSELSGAGDTTAAVLALGLSAGLDIVEAAKLANLAASVVVSKSGTACVTVQELAELV